MRPDYTHIAVILDRTGSMEGIRDDCIGGFNAFVAAQQQAAGEATLTLVQFDSQDPYEVCYRFRPIAEVPALTRATFVPRASTPLLDAIGRGINDLDSSLARLPRDQRPSRVVMVIVTDGHENASQEFDSPRIRRMIRDRQQTADWQFVFLSADLAGIDDARAVGIAADACADFAPTPSETRAAWGRTAASISAYRSNRTARVSLTGGTDEADSPGGAADRDPGPRG